MQALTCDQVHRSGEHSVRGAARLPDAGRCARQDARLGERPVEQLRRMDPLHRTARGAQRLRVGDALVAQRIVADGDDDRRDVGAGARRGGQVGTRVGAVAPAAGTGRRTTPCRDGPGTGPSTKACAESLRRAGSVAGYTSSWPTRRGCAPRSCATEAGERAAGTVAGHHDEVPLAEQPVGRRDGIVERGREYGRRGTAVVDADDLPAGGIADRRGRSRQRCRGRRAPTRHRAATPGSGPADRRAGRTAASPAGCPPAGSRSRRPASRRPAAAMRPAPRGCPRG